MAEVGYNAGGNYPVEPDVDASTSRAPTSSKKWEKTMIFGSAILLLVLFQIILFTSLKSSLDFRIAENQAEIEKIVTKLDGEY